jgi:hypothetical protein
VDLHFSVQITLCLCCFQRSCFCVLYPTARGVFYLIIYRTAYYPVIDKHSHSVEPYVENPLNFPSVQRIAPIHDIRVVTVEKNHVFLLARLVRRAGQDSHSPVKSEDIKNIGLQALLASAL